MYASDATSTTRFDALCLENDMERKKSQSMNRLRFPDRRMVVSGIAAMAATPLLSDRAQASADSLHDLPPIGMGTWITFDVGDDSAARAQRVEVLRAFFEEGGRLVDSSPMYGSAEDVLGHCLARLGKKQVFAASKVWIPAVSFGPEQIAASRSLWGVERFDSMQVHNLLSYEGHIETLRAMKAEGQVGSIGVTTSHGRRHDRLADIIESDDSLDSVQLTYNILDREAEARLLPMLGERGRAVIVNRPFRRGQIIERLRGRPLPDFASEIGVETWPQYLLKWIISHPAVTLAIPATSNVRHMRENMAAMRGPMPDAAMRVRMLDPILAL